MLGGTGSSVTIGDIAASTAAQVGNLAIVTVDANGTLGNNSTILADFAAGQAVQDGRLTTIEAVNTTQDTRLTDVEGVNATQTTEIAAIKVLDTTQNQRITATEAVNTTQGTQITAIQALNTVQDTRLTAVEGVNTSQSTRLTALENAQASTFNLIDHNRNEARRGIAAAAAMTTAPLPSAPGKTSYAANTAYYRGKVAFSLSFAHAIDIGSPFALTAGVAHSGGSDTVGRVGIAGEF